MAKKTYAPSKVTALDLPLAIAEEVMGWRNQGYHPLPSPTTKQLLDYWFGSMREGEQFHDCQQLAIETVIYLHECCGVRVLRDVYERFAPERLKLFKTVADEVNGVPFAKHCIKSATGSGKTWVLNALIVWQYFNWLNGASNAPYSARFMIVTPGLEVRNRILDSLKGRMEASTGNRLPETADLKRALFMPDDIEWRGRFDLLNHVLEPDDIRANATPPEGAFIAVTNWQQFRLEDDEPSLAQQLGLDSPDEQPQGRIVADFMTEYPDLIVMNDEAHHVHGKKTARAEELVWRKFMNVLHEQMKQRHGESAGLFMQIDFSATPFYGSGTSREYFPHIVYDYDLKLALNEMLVKQLFLEKRTQAAGEQKLENLDFRAQRDDERQVIALSMGQKQLIDIGLSKLNQLAEDFRNKGLNRKPVYMVLCEDTTVADLVHQYLLTCKNHEGKLLQERELLLFHSELRKEKHGYTLEEARGKSGVSANHPTLQAIDDDEDPVKVVISVLALREGFDKTNICVICALRASEADILLEQIVGRGLRLMFPKHKSDATIQEAKWQAVEALKHKEKPLCSLDFLYIVEHPRFETFYEDLRKEGYLIGEGDSSETTPSGDLVPVEAQPHRVEKYDIAWPAAVHESGKLPDLATIDVKALPAYNLGLDQVRSVMGTISVTDVHLATNVKAATWALKNPHFNYDAFIAQCADVIVRDGKTPVLTAKWAEIAGLVDEYAAGRLFKTAVNFSDEHNYKVLAYQPLADFVTTTLKNVVYERIGRPHFQLQGHWRRLSDLPRILVREEYSIPTAHCIYPHMGYSRNFGGLERDVMSQLLDNSAEVIAWCRLQRRHGLTIAYRDPSGILRSYEVDFIVRTAERNYILETKSDKDMLLPTVGLKARAARHWCESISGATGGPAEQAGEWEYLLLTQSAFDANRLASFEALLPLMRQARDKVVAAEEGGLFA